MAIKDQKKIYIINLIIFYKYKDFSKKKILKKKIQSRRDCKAEIELVIISCKNHKGY